MAMTTNEQNQSNRRAFLRWMLTGAGIVGGSFLISSRPYDDYVWQIDPNKCTGCGKCATECVLTPSAVKCVHAYNMCGYCDLCSGYFIQDAVNLDTGAENQLCPTAAIKRTFIEEPYFEYTINEELCLGCARCVKACGAFGNGSLFLQVRHDRCLNCNQCAIARACPAKAYTRIPRKQLYIMKTRKAE